MTNIYLWSLSIIYDSNCYVNDSNNSSLNSSSSIVDIKYNDICCISLNNFSSESYLCINDALDAGVPLSTFGVVE